MQASLPQAFTRAQAAQIELLTALGHTLLNGASQLAPLAIDVARGTLTEAALFASSLPGAKTPQDLVTAQGNFADALRDSATRYSRTAYEISSDTQTKLGKLVDTHVAELQQTVTEAIEQVGSAAPSGANGLVDMLKSIATASASSYQEAAKTLRQAAEATVATATAATASAAPSARKGRQSA